MLNNWVGCSQSSKKKHINPKPVHHFHPPFCIVQITQRCRTIGGHSLLSFTVFLEFMAHIQGLSYYRVERYVVLVDHECMRLHRCCRVVQSVCILGGFSLQLALVTQCSRTAVTEKPTAQQTSHSNSCNNVMYLFIWVQPTEQLRHQYQINLLWSHLLWGEFAHFFLHLESVTTTFFILPVTYYC